MWQTIIEAILRVDSTLPNQLENQKKVKPQSQGTLNNLLSLDTSHLVDFASLQKKVNSYNFHKNSDSMFDAAPSMVYSNNRRPSMIE